MKIFFFFLLVSLFGCAKPESESLGSGMIYTPVEGTDFTGKYSLSGVECYSSGGALTAAASITSGTLSDVLDIYRNTVSELTSGSSCNAETKAKIVFNPSDPSYGYLNITNQTTTTNTANNCSITMSLSYLSGGVITPSSITVSFENNGNPGDVTNGVYLNNSDHSALAILSGLKVMGSSSDLCFMIYLKH